MPRVSFIISCHFTRLWLCKFCKQHDNTYYTLDKTCIYMVSAAIPYNRNAITKRITIQFVKIRVLYWIYYYMYLQTFLQRLRSLTHNALQCLMHDRYVILKHFSTMLFSKTYILTKYTFCNAVFTNLSDVTLHFRCYVTRVRRVASCHRCALSIH